MQTSAGSNHLGAGAQPEMISVSQNDARIEIIFQRFKAHALDRARRTDGHEDGRLDGSAPSVEHPCAGFTVARNYLESDWGLVDGAIGPRGHNNGLLVLQVI